MILFRVKSLILFVIIMYFTLFQDICAQLVHSKIKNVVRKNEKGNICAIYNIDSPSFIGDPVEAAKRYLKVNKKLFGFDDDLRDLKVVCVKESHGIKHVLFRQIYKAMEILGSEIVVSLNSTNCVTMIVSGYEPNLSLDVVPQISVTGAETIALNLKSELGIADNVIPKSKLELFRDDKSNVRLVYLVKLLKDELFSLGQIVIDANSGDIIKKSSNNSAFVTGNGRVFEPDPGTYFGRTDLIYSSYVDAAYKQVNLENLNNTVGGNYYVRGQYAQSRDLYYPHFTPVSRTDLNFIYNKYETGFTEINIYYFVNEFRTYIGNLGFSPTWKFLGQTNSWIAFDAYITRAPFDYNSFYMDYETDEGGITEELWFGYLDNKIPWGHDQSCILHEYGHALHDALILGGYDDGDILLYPHLSGLSEGIGDYLAISFRRTLQNGDYRPNEVSNYVVPFARTSIKSASNANYSLWDNGDAYFKGSIWASTMMDLEYNNATDITSGENLGREITTKLLLKSLSYVSKDKSPIDYVNAIFQADRDLYDGIHLEALETVFDNRGFFNNYEVSGTISSNTTWSDYRLVTGDVTIASGVTLTIGVNTFVFFESGKKLIVNGTLNVPGTSSSNVTFERAGTSGTWGGIIFNSGSSGSINYANISNASCGIKCNGEDDVTISNCNITDSYIGIYTLNTSSVFDEPVISNTEISNCNNGIVASSSHPDVNYTYVTNCQLGYYSYYSQSNLLQGYNRIYNNDGGVLAIAANLKLGNSTYWGYNRLGLSTSYNLDASNYSTIDAIGNYWGTSPPTGIEIESGSTVNYTPYQSSDPTGAMMNISTGKSIERLISYSILSSDVPGDLPNKIALARQLLSEEK